MQLEISSGDTAWILVSTAMVMLMTPGVGLFYGGLVRSKTVVSMIGLSFLAFAIASIQWVLFGYSLSFGSDISGIIGGYNYILLNSVGLDGAPLAGNIPHLIYMAFQLVFAAVTLAILTSAVAERVRLSSFIVLAFLWTTLVYDPLAHWVWAGGWLAQTGALDFAGGTVVHISSGFSALAIALVIGKRVGFGSYVMEPHNIPMAMIGAGLLWFGWFGFNAGSALAANGLAANALVVTNTSAAAGALTWLAASWLKGKPSALGMVSGGIAGLVAITPAAGYVDVSGAIIIGALPVSSAIWLCSFASVEDWMRAVTPGQCTAWEACGV
jgi:Amt family ammonium transporter